MWNWIKQKSVATWRYIKGWWVAALVSLGIIAGGVAYSQNMTIDWVNATQRVDGSAFTLAELAETRIYCDGSTVPIIVVTDDSTTATVQFGVGIHTCHATHVDTIGQESDPSNIVGFTIVPGRPNPPTSFSVSP